MVGWWTVAAAQTPFVGTVGAYPVRGVLPAGSAPGSLTYVRRAATFGLSGACGEPCALTEAGADGTPTGQLAGAWSGAEVAGTWRTPDGRTSLPLRLETGPDAAVVWSVTESWPRSAHPVKTEPVTVALPRVLVTDPTVQARLDALLAPELFLDDPPARVVVDGWVDEVSYDVALDRAGVVAIVATVEGSGAYPDRFRRAVTVDVRTGARIDASTFTEAGRAALVAVAAAEQDRRRATADPEVRALVADAAFTEAGLAGAYPTEAGLHLTLSWGVPHALAALSPDDAVIVPWAVVLPTLAPGSPLGRLAR